MSIIRGKWVGQVQLDFWYDDETPGMENQFERIEKSVKTRYKKFLQECIEREQGKNVTVTVKQLHASLRRQDPTESRNEETT